MAKRRKKKPPQQKAARPVVKLPKNSLFLNVNKSSDRLLGLYPMNQNLFFEQLKKVDKRITTTENGQIMNVYYWAEIMAPLIEDTEDLYEYYITKVKPFIR